MPLVGAVGRKRFRARFAMGVVYVVLTLGAITTLYPFLVMASTGFKGPTDMNDNQLVPVYWNDPSELLIKYRDDKYAGNADMMVTMRTGEDASEADVKRYQEMLKELPPNQWLAGFRTPSNAVTSRLNLAWQDFLRNKYKSLDAVNHAYGEISGDFKTISPPPEKLDDPAWTPKPGQKWDDWMEFKNGLPVEFRIPITARLLWQDYWRTKVKNQFAEIPESVRGDAKTINEIDTAPVLGASSTEFDADFLKNGVPPVIQKAGFLENKWGSKNLPIYAEEQYEVKTDGGRIKDEFAARNYHYIFDMVAVNGHALINTIIFCLLTIGIQLTVNPLAAYALSRYPMKATARILVFLLATMAFPAEVTMIPAFLLLKDLGLLNTFAALVLPTAASGYMIFLLKGFFDSLPQEIFDSGQIDGAPEWKMMLKLAFPLSKPVFGYLALLAFMGAYGAFLYAFLVAQDRRIWTLMVYIYQLQQTAPKPVIMAATTIAAVPTLIVFLMAQKVIMRGIVLPGER